MIVYKEESYKIIGAAFKVYNGLGPIIFMPPALS
jgi:hypothetical protein